MKGRTHNLPKLTTQRRTLRNNSTSAEAMLWNMLKSRQLGVKFRRQFSIGQYVLDFYSPEINLCIELDGEPHFTFGGSDYDYGRTEYLKKYHNIRTLRFENREFFNYPEEVVNTIKKAIGEQKVEMMEKKIEKAVKEAGLNISDLTQKEIQELKEEIVAKENEAEFLDGVLWGVQRRLTLKRRNEMLAEIEKMEKHSKL